eukprot:CFRG3212T1
MQSLRNLRLLRSHHSVTVMQNLRVLSRLYSNKPKTLLIEKTFEVSEQQRPWKTKVGDNIAMHYKGMLEDNTVFDESTSRGPLSFQLGAGMVISGWDQGLLDMHLGEKRKLTIPSHLAYGDQGFPGIIPGGATLIFETELVAINDMTLMDVCREENDNGN